MKIYKITEASIFKDDKLVAFNFYESEIKKACANIRPAVLSVKIGRGKCGLYNALKGKASVEKLKEIYEVIYEQK